MARRKPDQRPAWLNADNSYDLLIPVDYSVGGEPHRLITLPLRRLTAAELLILDESIPYTEKLMRIVQAMTDHMRAVVIRIDAVDWDRIDDILGYFREPGSVTGATS
ncbi:MAG: hypothetical protein AB7E60_10220 [Sphingobium sp.]